MKVSAETVRRPQRWLVAYGASAAVVGAGLAAVWAAYPAQRDWLSREGDPIEGLTAALYTAGALISLASIRGARRRGQSLAGYWLLGGSCLLAALDEVSYGQGVVPGLTFPVVLGVKLDSLHDLVDVGRVALVTIGATRRHLAIAAAVVAGAAVVWRRSLWARLSGLAPGLGRFWLVAVAVALGLVAQAMDVLRISVFLEETLELEAALALLFATIAGTAWTRGRAA